MIPVSSILILALVTFVAQAVMFGVLRAVVYTLAIASVITFCWLMVASGLVL